MHGRPVPTIRAAAIMTNAGKGVSALSVMCSDEFE